MNLTLYVWRQKNADEKGRMEDAYLDSRGEIPNASFIGLKDEYLKLDIRLSAQQTGAIWRMPVETISLSEAGFEKVYQSSSVLLLWDIEINKSWHTVITQKTTTF